MKKRISPVFLVGIFVLLLVSCEIDSGSVKVPVTDGSWYIYSGVELQMERMVSLFENTLRLGDEIRTEGPSRYFKEQTIFREQTGWWGVMDNYYCLFRMYIQGNPSLHEAGTKWTGLARYFSNDSLIAECIGPNRWKVEGYTRGGENEWNTKISMEISCETDRSVENWDEEILYADVKGVAVLSQYYPSSRQKIEFQTSRPLVREKKTAGFSYAFSEGMMTLEVTDIRTGRKEKILAEIEKPAFDTRNVRITTRGVTGIY